MSASPPDDALSARLGDAASFRAEMRELIPRVVVDSGGHALSRPLARLNLDMPGDPTLALVDAFAEVADILSFYQDRVLNEAYLSTAVEYRSLALIGRGLGESPGAFVGASAQLAVFAQPGEPVQVPQGAPIQATPPASRGAPASGTAAAGAGATTGAAAIAAAPVFETATALTAVPALNTLTPLQTRPAWVTPDATQLLLAGTGLGLQVGDFLLFKRASPAPVQWVRLTVFSVAENHVLSTTTIGIGDPIGDQWAASGATDPFPVNAAHGLELYAFDLTCRLFGYNAPSWSSQSAAVQRANTPTGMVPSEFSEWPGFAIDLDDLDLQAVYPKVLPGAQFLLETPQDKTLGTIQSVARQNVSEFGMSGQVTQVVLSPDPATLPSGSALIPSRMGHSATTLSDGRVLLVGGIGVQGVLDSVEIYDPATQLVTQLDPLPAPRGLHSASIVDGLVYLAGGVAGDWSLAETLMVFDPATMRFTTIAGVTLATPRVAHAALVLPDNRIMLSGGMTLAKNQTFATIDALYAALAATPSVVLFDPAAATWQPCADLARPRAGHSATLCPVVEPASAGGGPAMPPIGNVVVFVGGHDGGAPAPGSVGGTTGTIWADAELTTLTDWQPTGICTPIAAGKQTGSARYDHVAVPLPGNAGFLVTGGQSAQGPVGDNWLLGAFADAPVNGQVVQATPVFVPAPALSVPRASHAAALLAGNKVAVAGGIAGDAVLATTESFAVAAGVSIPFDGAKVIASGIVGSPLPAPQGYPGFAPLAQDFLLLAGGCSTLPDGYTGAVVAFDADVGTFLTLPGPVLTTPDTIAPVGTILLADGTILILGTTAPAPFPAPTGAMTGFAWTFDPASGLSTSAGPPITARIGASLSLLPNGTVLVAGGFGVGDSGYAVLDTAEIYDPKSRSFRKVGNRMTTPRCGHSATVLADGTVLLAGGFDMPAITYDPPGLRAFWAPALTTAETFATGTQSFTAIPTRLPSGYALHSATLLPSGDVLIAGGVSAIQGSWPFARVEAFPVAQAALFNPAAQGFALIAPMPSPRAMHSATLLPNGKILIAGGTATATLVATDTTLLFDPDTIAFTAWSPLSAARRGQGAVLIDQGVLFIGGDRQATYEIAPLGGTGVAPLYPLPIPLPSPPYPDLVALTASVTPVPLAGHGVYAFGGAIDAAGNSTCTAVLFAQAPAPASSDARRQALVYTQSRSLTLAPPIDTAPLPGNTPIGQEALPADTLVLSGLIDEIVVGQSLLLAGNPPLARTLGAVTRIGGAPLASDTLLMVYAPIPQPGECWWWANLPDTGNLSLETAPDGTPPSGLYFLSGNGSTIGNVTADQLARFDRPVQSEAVTVKAIARSAADNVTTLTLQAPLRYLYDRTTTTVYGNVVTVTQGSSVTGEVLGSGDGQRPFQQFLLKQAPLTWLEEPDGSIAPQLSVTVNGAEWRCVAALGDAGPDARVYQLSQDAQGRARITFGDGVHGLRPPTGTDNITATYRVGAGPGGNVAAGSITRPPMGVGGIKGVLNPVAASGGIGAPARSDLRSQIPIAVADLGRVINRQDMVSFVLNRPEVGSAVLSVARTGGADPDGDAANAFLLTLAEPDNGVPDMHAPAFTSLAAALDAALAIRLDIRLLPFDPLPFKVDGWFVAQGGADIHAIQQSIGAAIGAAYALPAMAFDELVRAADIIRLVEGVAGVKKAGVTRLWAPTEAAMTPVTDRHPVPGDSAVLAPARARLDPPTGAQILYLSADADAVTFIAKTPAGADG